MHIPVQPHDLSLLEFSRHKWFPSHDTSESSQKYRETAKIIGGAWWAHTQLSKLENKLKVEVGPEAIYVEKLNVEAGQEGAQRSCSCH